MAAPTSTGSSMQLRESSTRFDNQPSVPQFQMGTGDNLSQAQPVALLGSCYRLELTAMPR